MLDTRTRTGARQGLRLGLMRNTTLAGAAQAFFCTASRLAVLHQIRQCLGFAFRRFRACTFATVEFAFTATK